MFEKVNPSHPDKLADRIAGAIVDLAYAKKRNPKVAVEVLIGHGKCSIVSETSTEIQKEDVVSAVRRITGTNYIDVEYREFRQDPILHDNQKKLLRCGDNGIFRGMPVTQEQRRLSEIAHLLYDQFPHDGKYILNMGDVDHLIVCQSNVGEKVIRSLISDIYLNMLTDTQTKFVVNQSVNPLGYWTGGTDVDSGATNRKLGSDMGDAVTGGGLHGKDLTKADVSVNIYAHLKAQEVRHPVELYCAIGDETVDGKPYGEIVEIAREYIDKVGGFEKFAEWGLI